MRQKKSLLKNQQNKSKDDNSQNKKIEKEQLINDSQLKKSHKVIKNNKSAENKNESVESSNSNLIQFDSDLKASSATEKPTLPTMNELDKTEIMSNSRESSPTRSIDGDTMRGKKSRLPPIVIKTADSQQIIDSFKKNNSDINFVIKNNNKGCVLKTYNRNNYYQTIEKLKELNIEFITYTNRAEKNKTIVLKGLNTNSNSDEVHSELQGLNLINVQIIKVIEMQIKNKKNNNGKIFIVQITPESDIKELIKIEFINHQIIKWEPLRREGLVQCKRCQRLVHTAFNCNMMYRCVKCVEKHEPGQCPIDKDKNLPIQCILCGKTGHPASYRGCQVHIQENQNNKRRNILANPAKRKLYAEMAAQPMQSKRAAKQQENVGLPDDKAATQQGSQVDKFSKLENAMLQVTNKISNFGSEMASFKTDISKLIADDRKIINDKVDINSKNINNILNHLGLEWKQ